MAEGYVKLHRQILEFEWFADSSTMHVLTYLLITVNWKEASWLGQTIPAGGTVTSREKIAAHTGLTEKQVRRALDNLEKGRVIVRDRAGKGQLVTLVNWAKYQGDDVEQGRQRASNRADKGPTKGQQQGRQRAAIEEGKERESGEEGKKGKNEELPLTGGGEPPKAFGDPIINELMEHLKALNGGKLDGTIKANRFACSNLVNEAKKKIPEPTASLRAFLTECKALDHHGPLCTSFDYIQRNQVKLTNLIRQKRENSTTNGKATTAQRGQPTITERMERGRLALAGLGYTGGAGDADPGHYDPHEVVG